MWWNARHSGITPVEGQDRCFVATELVSLEPGGGKLRLSKVFTREIAGTADFPVMILRDWRAD